MKTATQTQSKALICPLCGSTTYPNGGKLTVDICDICGNEYVVPCTWCFLCGHEGETHYDDRYGVYLCDSASDCLKRKKERWV